MRIVPAHVAALYPQQITGMKAELDAFFAAILAKADNRNSQALMHLLDIATASELLNVSTRMADIQAAPPLMTSDELAALAQAEIHNGLSVWLSATKIASTEMFYTVYQHAFQDTLNVRVQQWMDTFARENLARVTAFCRNASRFHMERFERWFREHRRPVMNVCDFRRRASIFLAQRRAELQTVMAHFLHEPICQSFWVDSGTQLKALETAYLNNITGELSSRAFSKLEALLSAQVSNANRSWVPWHTLSFGYNLRHAAIQVLAENGLCWESIESVLPNWWNSLPVREALRFVFLLLLFRTFCFLVFFGLIVLCAEVADLRCYRFPSTAPPPVVVKPAFLPKQPPTFVPATSAQGDRFVDRSSGSPVSSMSARHTEALSTVQRRLMLSPSVPAAARTPPSRGSYPQNLGLTPQRRLPVTARTVPLQSFAFSIGYTPTGRTLHVGPRGGVYHISRNGNKVYHKR